MLPLAGVGWGGSWGSWKESCPWVPFDIGVVGRAVGGRVLGSWESHLGFHEDTVLQPGFLGKWDKMLQT